jgi:hypothetical protein
MPAGYTVGMIEYSTYAGRVQSLGTVFTRLPAWARFTVGIFAVPGLLLAALSLLGLLVSILALLILALPVYVLLKRVTLPATIPSDPVASPGVKRVEATIVE